METMKDEGSFHKPPVLDGANYDYWKSTMNVFLTFMDNKTCKFVIKGWKHPMVTTKNGTTSLKLGADWTDAEWTDAEDVKALGISKAFE